MTAKLDFQAIYNNELKANKLNFGSLNIALSVAAGVPAANADVGSLYVDTNSGNLYRKSASGASNWIQIASITSTVFQNHYKNIFINSALTATNTGAASLGDLVGIYGAGAWAASGLLSVSKRDFPGIGSQNAALVAGGFVAANTSLTEVFDGTSWSTSAGVLVAIKASMPGAGSQNACFIAGGAGAAAFSTTELFNGSSWASGGIMSASRTVMGGAGTQTAGLISGGNSGGSVQSVTELFNGSTWTVSGNMRIARSNAICAGAQGATVFAGGVIGSDKQKVCELFNGSVWNMTSNMTSSRSNGTGGGSQNSAIAIAGEISANLSSSEIFNGTVWALSGNLSGTKRLSAGGGSQNNAFICGGFNDAANLKLTEIHTQTTYRKLYSREYNTVKSVGILINAGTVQQQGSITTSITYVANKWLIANRYMNSTPASDASLTGVALTSISGNAPSPVYNFSATVLSLVPGMMAIITTGGATPAPSADYGTFLISKVTDAASVTLVNNSSISQNPATGTISFISTMLAVDQVSPQDIVIGRTDDNGYLTIHKPIIISNLNKRLK